MTAVVRLRRIVNTTVPIATMSMLRIVSRITGSLNASSPPVSGSYIYNWRVALASAPTTYVKQQQTTAASNTFDSLTPGQLYNVELNAVGTAGTTDWSGPGELMII